jgi:hypothetical protein
MIPDALLLFFSIEYSFSFVTLTFLLIESKGESFFPHLFKISI